MKKLLLRDIVEHIVNSGKVKCNNGDLEQQKNGKWLSLKQREWHFYQDLLKTYDYPWEYSSIVRVENALKRKIVIGGK